MHGRTSQNSPMALPAGEALEATRLQAGDSAQQETQRGQPPRTRKTGYTLLLAAEALPSAFLEETDEDARTYTEPGDHRVRQAVQALRQAVERYNVCWCTAPEQLAGNLHRVFVAPSPALLSTNRALPLFLTDEELEAALNVVPAPRRSLRSPLPPTQGAVAVKSPEPSASPVSTSAQGAQPERITVYASLKTIRWAFSTLERSTQAARLPFRLRQLWLLRAALQAILRDGQRLDDLPGTAGKVRRVLVCRRKAPPDRVKIEPCYEEEGHLAGFELVVIVPPALAAAA